MRQSGIPLSDLNSMKTAHVTEPEFLNSQKIEARYGSYHVDMLSSDGMTRQSALSSDSDTGRVCRTFALTRFTDEAVEKTPITHQQIAEGASIGATLQRDGWSVLKATIHVGSLTIPDPAHPVLGLMQLAKPETLAMHIYKLAIQKEAAAFDYATIIEIHHPDYLDEDDVRALFPVDRKLSAKPPQVDELISIILEAA